MSKKINVLHVLGCLGMGGAEGRIMDLVRNNKDENIHYDFLVHSSGPDHYDAEAEGLGCHIYRIPKYRIYNGLQYKRALKKFFSSHSEIDVVVGSMTSTASIYLPIAKKYGKVTVAHARSAGVDGGLKKKLTLMLRKNLPGKTDYMWSCSTDAAKVVFGEDTFNNGLVKVIYDNIDVDSFALTPDIKERAQKIREQYGITDKFVVGHVGSFRYAKNHEFLVEVFSEIRKLNSNAVLLMAGAGDLLESIKKKVNDMGLEDCVIFAGQQSDIAAFYHAFDLFIFPSHFEGMPGTVLESQASALPVVCSDTITRDVDVTDYVKYISLNKPASLWASESLAFYNEINEKRSVLPSPADILKEKGFDVHIESVKLNQLYHKYADYKPNRILHISGGMYPGGQENFIMNIFRNIDRTKTQFDIVLHSIRPGDYVPEIQELGGHVYLAPRKSRHPIGNFFAMKRIVKEGGYNIVIRHSDNAFAVVDMIAAKLGGAKVRIFHSHSSNSYAKGLHRIFRSCMGWAVNKRFACSENAGKWMYGKRDFTVINNAIDIEKNVFNQETRDRVRKEWGLEGMKVYAHVGIYFPVKNHLFLIRVFNEIQKKQDNARLVLIGEGPMRQEMEALIKELSLEDKVILTGVRYDVADLLQMADVFCFPSIYEGLPLSVIEAQSAGLHCLLSDVITKEVIVTDLVSQMSLDEGEVAWAERAIALSEAYERKNTYEEIAEAGYDVKKLALFYEKLAEDSYR